MPRSRSYLDSLDAAPRSDRSTRRAPKRNQQARMLARFCRSRDWIREMEFDQRRETVDTLLRLFHECDHPRDRINIARALITCERIALEEYRSAHGI